MSVVQFIIIGSMKSGTTTLSDYLSLNEDVAMCRPKEPQFFSCHFNKGVGYYESLWPDKNKICGEASTCYSRWPFYDGVPERIATYNPKMKLIFIMRHPFERAYSNYRHNVLQDRLPYTSFGHAISQSDEILMTSMYMQQINKYLEYFPREQILLLDFNELKNNPLQLINQIESFVGAKKTTKLGIVDDELKSNQAGMARAKNDLYQIVDKVRHLPVVGALVDNLISPSARAKIRTLIRQKIANSKLVKLFSSVKTKAFKPATQEERENFLAKIMPDIEKLELFWGKDLSQWKS